MIKQRHSIKNSNENCDFFCCYQERNVFTQINITLRQIELQMPDTTQMKAILKGFPNVMDFHEFKLNSKKLDIIKDDFKSYLKILHRS